VVFCICFTKASISLNNLDNLTRMMQYFIKAYCTTLSLLIPILYTIHSTKQHQTTVDLSIWSVILFSLISASAYFLVTYVAKSAKQQLFISFTMTNTLVKMATAVLILVLYRQQHNELKPIFIIPFLVIYITFTIFETTVMIHAANQKPS
jgi:UDP-N-acetylmuramyl pentapeptide phosphotransferase/UDP-N-acetylglucosamine-1-phosphate transferase